MKVLFTNKVLNFPAGTQVVVRDLAVALKIRGWQVAVFTLQAGPFANDIRKHGIVVTEQLGEIPFKPEIIHAHHYEPALKALNFFSATPAISFIHDRLSPIDIPPRHKNIMHYLASDFNVYDRLVSEAHIPASYVNVLLNWVDVTKFPLRHSWNEKPKNALVFSNYATKDNYFKIIQKACAAEGIPVDAVGQNMGNIVTDPGPLLCRYDIVFAKAKAAMEAIATGAVVIPCDKFGLGKIATMSNYDHYRKFNFGMKILDRPVLHSLVTREIRNYSIADARMLASAIRKDADFDSYVNALIGYYEQAVHLYANGFTTWHKAVGFSARRYWVKRKLMSRKRELQKQLRRFKRFLKYGS